MSYPTLRPEYWREQERQQQARDARIGRTGTEAERRYCNARRVRWWGIIAFTMWLTYALRKLDASGLWLLVGILVLTPLLVIVVGDPPATRLLLLCAVLVVWWRGGEPVSH